MSVSYWRMKRLKFSLLIYGGIWQCEVTLPPASNPDFNLQHTHTTHTHTHNTHTYTLPPCGEREDWEKIDLPPCGVLRGLKPLRMYFLCSRLKRPPTLEIFIFWGKARHAGHVSYFRQWEHFRDPEGKLDKHYDCPQTFSLWYEMVTI